MCFYSTVLLYSFSINFIYPNVKVVLPFNDSLFFVFSQTLALDDEADIMPSAWAMSCE